MSVTAAVATAVATPVDDVWPLPVRPKPYASYEYILP